MILHFGHHTSELLIKLTQNNLKLCAEEPTHGVGLKRGKGGNAYNFGSSGSGASQLVPLQRSLPKDPGSINKIKISL